MTRASLITLLTAVILSGLAAATQNAGKVWWPQFRGPNSSGVGEGKPPVNFGPDQNVLWKTALGPGLSSPIIWEGRIFPTEFDREAKQLATLCIDRRTGKILWRRSVAPERIEKVHAISSPAAATPATDGERVYVYFGSYGLVCYDLDGNQKWEKPLPLPQNPYGAAASPILAGELLVLNHQGKESYLLGVNRHDGSTVWKTARKKFQYGWSTPVHWCHDGIDEIVVLGGDFRPNQRLMAYNLASMAAEPAARLRGPSPQIEGTPMKIKLTSVYVDDQEKALRFYTEVLGFAKKADFSQGPYRWLTVASPEDPDGTELQLALNDNPAAKAYQQAMFQQGQPAAMFFSDDVKGDYERIKARGAEFTMAPTQVPGSTIAKLNDTCGNVIQITQLARW